MNRAYSLFTIKSIDEEQRIIEGIATTHFTSADVVRHPLVARIVEAYGRADAARADEDRR